MSRRKSRSQQTVERQAQCSIGRRVLFVPNTQSPGSMAGAEYEVASGQKIPNEGQKKLLVVTETDQQRAMTVQICDVNKALLSVKRTCATGHRVVFDDDGSSIKNKNTMERTPLKEEGGVYTLDARV